MIDTIRFRIKISDRLAESIKAISLETTKKNNVTGDIQYQYHNASIFVGSYNRDLNLFLSDIDERYVYLEFSAPKLHYGHNIFLFYPEDLPLLLNNLYSDLLKSFGAFPVYSEWEIMRIDLCYSWKFLEENLAEKILSILQSYNYPRKRNSFHDTSLMSVGSTYSVKFYLKYNEFQKNDFKHFHKSDLEYAYKLLELSKNILRFEITFRKPALKAYFSEFPLKLSSITTEKTTEILQKLLGKLLKDCKPVSMTSTEAFNQLKNEYKEQKAVRLWEFWTLFSKPESQRILKKSYNRTTIYRNTRDLRKASVGLNNSDNTYSFDLSIPSQNVINAGTVSRAAAGEDAGI